MTPTNINTTSLNTMESSSQNTVFISQDEHLLHQIKGSTTRRVAVSVYNQDHDFISHAQKQLKKIGIEDIDFFDSGSPGAWNNPQIKKQEPQKKAPEAYGEKVVAIQVVPKLPL